MPDQSARIEQCIEILCGEGCSKVYEFIQALEKNEEFREVAHMSMAERGTVLVQLLSIMDIYKDGSCDG